MATYGADDSGTGTFTDLTVTRSTNLHGETFITDQGLQVGASGNGAPLSVYGATTLSGGLTLQGNVSVTAFSGDTGLSPANNQTVPTQLAVKAYVDGQVTALNEALGQKAALAGSLSQPFAAQQLTLQTGGAVSAFSGDTGLSPGDNQTVPTQLAVKSYVDGKVTALNEVLGQKADLGGNAGQDFTTQNLTVNGNLTTTGSIGIGTSDPLRQLQIGEDVAGIGFAPADASPNAGYVRFGDGTGWKLHVGRSREEAHGEINNGTTGVLMTIQDNGNVGIGTTTPKYPLHIVGGVAAGVNFPGNWTYPGSSLTTCGLYIELAGGGAALSWHQFSDARIKRNPTPVDPMCSLATLADLTLYEYEYTPEYQPSLSGQKYHGFLAQEVEKVIPAAVSIIGDHTISDGQVIEGLRVVAHDRIFGEAVGAIQALHAMLQQQEARIRELEERNAVDRPTKSA